MVDSFSNWFFVGFILFIILMFIVFHFLKEYVRNSRINIINFPYPNNNIEEVPPRYNSNSSLPSYTEV